MTADQIVLIIDLDLSKSFYVLNSALYKKHKMFLQDEPNSENLIKCK